jgi:hypothetical protein
MAYSRDMAPAAYAAVISPLEWPTTAVGLIPRGSNSWTRAIYSAVERGWASSAR